VIPFAALPWGYSLAELAIAVVIIAAIVACVLVGLRYFGVQVPHVIIHVGWILLVAFVVVAAIRLLASM
jgi:hypothetical protein